jgi:D-lyxose ketol-isomerase
MIKSAGVAGIGLALLGTSTRARAAKPKINFKNSDFYDGNGNFIVDKGRDAYMALMEYHGYVAFDGLREALWVSDYGMGEFAKLGLGAYAFLNDEESGYLGQDMFLLPNQMLPQHYHLKTAKAPAKMEGWHVRHGISYTYGEGEPTKNLKAVVPASQKDIVTVWHETILNVGQTAKLERQTAPHWQFGGPEGAIISEYGTFHDNDGVRHSDPKIVFP